MSENRRNEQPYNTQMEQFSVVLPKAFEENLPTVIRIIANAMRTNLEIALEWVKIVQNIPIPALKRFPIPISGLTELSAFICLHRVTTVTSQ